jgi:hypothetical protein
MPYNLKSSAILPPPQVSATSPHYILFLSAIPPTSLSASKGG